MSSVSVAAPVFIAYRRREDWRWQCICFVHFCFREWWNVASSFMLDHRVFWVCVCFWFPTQHSYLLLFLSYFSFAFYLLSVAVETGSFNSAWVVHLVMVQIVASCQKCYIETRLRCAVAEFGLLFYIFWKDCAQCIQFMQEKANQRFFRLISGLQETFMFKKNLPWLL